MKPQPESSTQEVLAGLVERVTFHNVENGFCVLRAKARGHRELVTVVGHAATISAGEWITACIRPPVSGPMKRSSATRRSASSPPERGTMAKRSRRSDQGGCRRIYARATVLSVPHCKGKNKYRQDRNCANNVGCRYWRLPSTV